MTQIRPTVKRSQWILTKHEFYAAYHFALQYKDWKAEHDGLIGIKGMNYDGMPHGTNVGQPTETTAIKLADLGAKISLIEDLVRQTDTDMYQWLLRGVTEEGITYNYLYTMMHIPYSANTYYDRRRKFYYLLSKHINIGNQGTEY